MLKYRQVGSAPTGWNTTATSSCQAKSPTKPPSRGNCEAVSLLSSVVQTERISADHQTGDCEQDIEQLNIRHTHHLRFCKSSRGGNHPVEPTCLRKHYNICRDRKTRNIFSRATKRPFPIVYTGETRRKQKKPLGGRAGRGKRGIPFDQPQAGVDGGNAD